MSLYKDLADPSGSENWVASLASKRDPVAAFQLQHLPRLGGGGDVEGELGQDAADLAHLLGIALGQASGAEIDAVLEPDAHIAAHGGTHGRQRDLMAPRRRMDH